MRDYSFRFLDLLGRSQPSEHARFIDDQAATDFARDALVRSPIVEVWRGKECVMRLERPLSEVVAAPAIAAAPAVRPGQNPDPRIIAIHSYGKPVK